MTISYDKVNTALPLYVGYGITSYPKEDVSRLVSEFGSDLAAQMECEIKLLLTELDQLKPDWNTHSLISAAKWASEEIKRKHPELDSKAITALEWCFTWWWK